ncbi:unnamed protein product [Brassica oleracea var. botrytis]
MRWRELMPYSMLFAISIKWSKILSTIITADTLQLLPRLSLNQCHKVLEISQHLILRPHRKYPRLP